MQRSEASAKKEFQNVTWMNEGRNETFLRAVTWKILRSGRELESIYSGKERKRHQQRKIV